MSFEEGGDLASFAAIAESTIASKEDEPTELAPKGEEDGQSSKEEEGATNESGIDDTKK